MLGWATGVGLEVAYKHHYYTVWGQVMRQTDGGPMGVDLSVEGSDIYMLKWGKCFFVEGQGFEHLN